jgi:hypothetical protein
MIHSFQHKRITSADANTTVVVVSSLATLGFITINATSAQALTVKNGSGDTIAVIKASIAEQTLTYMIDCAKGITITVPASYTGDATISFV